MVHHSPIYASMGHIARSFIYIYTYTYHIHIYTHIYIYIYIHIHIYKQVRKSAINHSSFTGQKNFWTTSPRPAMQKPRVMNITCAVRIWPVAMPRSENRLENPMGKSNGFRFHGDVFRYGNMMGDITK